MRLLLSFALVACGPDPVAIDASWDVTVTGATTSCFTDGDAGYQKSFRYDVLYPDAASLEIYLDNELFASGQVNSGCKVEYQTPIWLEERGGPEQYLKWKIEGSAVVENAAGGCGLDEGVDWFGTEVIYVEESTDPDVPADCTYSLITEGVFLGNG